MKPIQRYPMRKGLTSYFTLVGHLPHALGGGKLLNNVYDPERQLGGLEVFLPYLRDYVETFRGTSIRTPEWKAHLFRYFQKNGGNEKVDVLNKVDWDVRLVSASSFPPCDWKR